MKQLIQVFFILFFYALGEGLSFLIKQLVPGSVLGMMLLFLCLRLKWVTADKVDNMATILSANMGLFFVPAGVGLITQTALMEKYWPAILLSIAVSTIIVVSIVGWSQDKIERRAQHKRDKISAENAVKATTTKETNKPEKLF